MDQGAPPADIQTGGGSGDALYGGAVKVRRGRKRVGGKPGAGDGELRALGKAAVAPSAKSSRTYTIVKMVMTLMFAKDGGAYKIPADTFQSANETGSNCTATKRAWASAVHANFTAPTNETVDKLGTAQRAFAECMYGAILKASGTGTPDQNELATILASAEHNEGVEMVDNAISFIISLNVGFAPSSASDESMAGGGFDSDSDSESDSETDQGAQLGGMFPTGKSTSSPASSSAPAPAPAAAAVVPQEVLVQVAAAPSLQGQLAVAQAAQNPPAGGAGAAVIAGEAPSSSYELARAAFRLFLSPFRSCLRTLPTADSVTQRLNSAAEAVENRRDILPTAVVVSSAAAGLLMPGAAGAALTGAANTIDAINAALPTGISVLMGAVENAGAAGSLMTSAGRLGTSAAGVYVASRTVGALTATGMRCAAGAGSIAVEGVRYVGRETAAVIEAAPGATARFAAAAPGATYAAAAATYAAAASASAATMSAGRRAAGAIRSAIGGCGGGRGEQIQQLAIANADAVEAVMDAEDEAAALAAATTGAASVRAAMSAAGGSGAYAEAAGNAIETRLKVLAGKKRKRGEMEAAAPAPAPAPASAASADAAAAPVIPGEGSDSKDEPDEEPPAANRPRKEGGCPMCGSHGGSRKKRRANKAKKSRKQKKRASYRRKSRKTKTKSRSPSEEIYASPPVPATITLPRMESSGPPVRS